MQANGRDHKTRMKLEFEVKWAKKCTKQQQQQQQLDRNTRNERCSSHYRTFFVGQIRTNSLTSTHSNRLMMKNAMSIHLYELAQL